MSVTALAQKKTSSGALRVWEIDAARGVAVIMTIVFHGVFDLAVYYGFQIDYLKGFWFYEGRISAILFMFISGISSTFSDNSAKRGLIVFAWAMIVTAVSIPVMGKYYIRFGILHFFGAVMILKGLLDKLIKDKRIMNIIAGCVIPLSFIIGSMYAKTHTTIPFLFPIGIITKDFSSYDYYPIFPWVSFFAAGVLVGGTFYKDKKSRFLNLNIYGVPAEKPRALVLITLKSVKALCFTGKYSLVIYLAHQPVLVALLYVLFNIFGVLNAN